MDGNTHGDRVRRDVTKKGKMPVGGAIFGGAVGYAYGWSGVLVIVALDVLLVVALALGRLFDWLTTRPWFPGRQRYLRLECVREEAERQTQARAAAILASQMVLDDETSWARVRSGCGPLMRGVSAM